MVVSSTELEHESEVNNEVKGAAWIMKVYFGVDFDAFRGEEHFDNLMQICPFKPESRNLMHYAYKICATCNCDVIGTFLGLADVPESKQVCVFWPLRFYSL